MIKEGNKRKDKEINFKDILEGDSIRFKIQRKKILLSGIRERRRLRKCVRST